MFIESKKDFYVLYSYIIKALVMNNLRSFTMDPIPSYFHPNTFLK